MVVQARQVLEESDFLLALADQTDRIHAVVGWVPLIDKNVSVHLERLSLHPKFKAVRHVLQEEPDAYFLRDDFHRGLSKLLDYVLSYDLLIFHRQLPVAIQQVDRQTNLAIIINHIAKLEASSGRIEPAWRAGMKEFAKRDNIIGVKFSGLLTEFPADEGDFETVSAYFHETLEIFLPETSCSASIGRSVCSAHPIPNGRKRSVHSRTSFRKRNNSRSTKQMQRSVIVSE
jgi:L-fuconolactonase